MFKKTQFQLTLFFSLIMVVVVGSLISLFHYSITSSIQSEQEFAVIAFAEEEALEHSIFINHGYSITFKEQKEMEKNSNICCAPYKIDT